MDGRESLGRTWKCRRMRRAVVKFERFEQIFADLLKSFIRDQVKQKVAQNARRHNGTRRINTGTRLCSIVGIRARRAPPFLGVAPRDLKRPYVGRRVSS